MTNSIKKKTIIAGILTLIASFFPDIIAKEFVGFMPSWWLFAKIFLLISCTLYLYADAKIRSLARYGFVLTIIVGVQIITGYVQALSWWLSLFPLESFCGQFGGVILLKLLGIIPVIVVLLLLYRSPRTVYLTKGDLSAKATRIPWLGIEEGKISWGKLSVISGLLIAIGTIILTVITVTGFSEKVAWSRLPPLLPFIIVFAGVNSLSEGVIFRNSVLGPLEDVLPKAYLIILAAIFFGAAHFYGAPGGIIGVIMSGVLGWYMCRSMYETHGFVTAWIIHFLQDIVIFSTIAVLGNFS